MTDFTAHSDVYKARDMQFFLQKVRNEVFKILKMFICCTTLNSPEQPVKLTPK